MSLILLAGGVGALLWVYSFFSLPDVGWLKTQNPKTTAFMQQYSSTAPLQFHWVSYTQISPYLKQGAVFAEDANFFNHHGVDWQAIWEAFKENWVEKEFKRGGSTITQQLAKNLFLSPSKNPLRKIREALIAFALERALSKQRILELYLNVVEWGEGIYGAEAAAQHYCNLPASSLSPSQAAKLAAMLPNPRYFQKVFNESHYLDQRAIKIFTRMAY